MKDCGRDDYLTCWECRKRYCINSCYNFSCTHRQDISEVSGLGCADAYECFSFISRKTYLERQKNEEVNYGEEKSDSKGII